MSRGLKKLKRRARQGVTAACVAGWWTLSTLPASAQCVLCRESLKSGGSRELITGFIFSTLLLTAVPVTLLSIFVFVIYRSVKRQAEMEAALGFEAAGERPAEPPAQV